MATNVTLSNQSQGLKIVDLSQHRNLSTKRDIRQRMFDKEQLMMYCKIRDARTQIDNVPKTQL